MIVGTSSANGTIKLVVRFPAGRHGPDRRSGGVQARKACYGTDGYVIFADYNGVATEAGKNTEPAMLRDRQRRFRRAAPFVTVNPAAPIGRSADILTGDGMASTINALTIQDILADNGTGLYSLSAGYLNTFRSYLGQLPLQHEQGVNLTNDFAVLVLEDTTARIPTQ
jgi:hypothetical protein